MARYSVIQWMYMYISVVILAMTGSEKNMGVRSFASIAVSGSLNRW